MERHTIKVDRKFDHMIGHRGASGLYTENTNLSFIEGTLRTYYGLECDVHPTKDNIIVVSHDSNLKRVVGIDLEIPAVTYDELRRIEFPITYNGIKNKECHILTLKEYIEICKIGNKKSIIELKGTIREEDITRILDIVKDANHLDDSIFISFYPGLLVKLKKECKEAKCQLLTSFMNDSILDFCVQHDFSIDCDYHVMTKEFIDKFHKYNLEVNVYTVDDKLVAEKLIDEGIDYITSNILEAYE